MNVKKIAFLGALAMAVPLVASAQGMGGGEPPPGMGGGPPAGGGGGMPDPRQMSGQARPDSAVPGGEITVRVIRGELAANAPVGTLVHLVGIAADGKATLRTVPVNDQGRSEFKELVTDGTVVYYALALFEGDRLISQAITLPPKVGVRLMLSGRKLADGKQVGPPIDDDKGEEGGAAAPAGEVELLVRGPVAPGQKVGLRRLGTDEATELALDDKGAARWTGVASAPDRVYVIEMKTPQRTFVSAPFMMAPQAGARRMMLAYDKLLFAIQGGAQADDNDLTVEMQLVVANLTGAPYATPPEGLLIPLPRGFQGAQLKDDEPGGRAAIEPGQGVRFHGTVPPGQKELVVGFGLPIDDGRASFDMPMPLGLFQSSFFIAKTGNMIITPGTGVSTAPRMQRADDGRDFYELADLTVSPGESLKFGIAGLPVPDRWQAVSRTLIGLIVTLLIVVALAVAVRRPKAVVRTAATRDGERRELIAQRERLYNELVSLERARAARRIDPDSFATQRRGIMARLVLVHRQIDDLDAPEGGADRPAAGSR